jgi:diguanylate cyclase (GGDEF)-like protein/PAS domain S-box-containing protein
MGCGVATEQQSDAPTSKPTRLSFMIDAIALALLLIALICTWRVRTLARRLHELSAQHAAVVLEVERLREVAMAASIADTLPVRISHFDRDERVLYANAYCGLVYGCDPSELLGKSIREVRGDKTYADIKPYIERVLKGEPVRYEHALDAPGSIKYFQQDYIPQFAPDGAVKGFFSISFEITDRRLNEERLHHQSRHDVLTGLWNRREFEERLPQAIARSQRSGRGMALAFIDIDHFKSINDRHGHPAGDQVLRVFADRIRQVMRSTDTVARLAGDEFIVIIEGLHHPDEAQAVAKKIIASMSEPMALGSASATVSASIGLAHCFGEPCMPEALLASADKALYEAKAAGRNTVRSSNAEAL